MNKREWVLRVLRNESVERVPLGFWFHFTADELIDGFLDPRVIERNIEGHKKFFREFQPDILKIMTDGFFMYPNREFQDARTAKELWKVKSIGPDHPWIEEQVAFAKTITGLFGGEVLTFYNIFSPATTFKFVRLGSGDFRAAGIPPDKLLADLIVKDADAVVHALGVAAGDLSLLARRVIEEGGVDGIYLSAQDPSDGRVDGRLHRAVIAPGDTAVLRAAKSAGASWNILHICGYEGCRNDFSHFVDYPADIINWASAFEKFSLGEGKKFFGGRPVIGGFDNTVKGILYRGGEEEIKAETRRLLSESGRAGVILGADCTLPRDIDLRRLQWVREAAESV
ncbi:MAG: uroporphyrinogen decarboxylase [Treponema sp.]|jgi:uroporphyrinogen decarboxylase|nr:uroporphyrinogen decarboxylase [Treponema sp.]